MKYRTLLFATALTAGFASFAIAQQDQTQAPANQPDQGGMGTTQPDVNQSPSLSESQSGNGEQPIPPQSTSSDQMNQTGTQPVEQSQTPTGQEPSAAQSDQPPATSQDQTQAQAGGQNQSEMQSAINLPEECRSYLPAASQAQSQQNMSSMQSMGQQSTGQLNDAQRNLHDAMAQSMQPMMTGMMNLDTDVAFVCAMIPHHQAAIDMARAELRDGDNARAKRFARNIIREQEREVRQMVEWVRQNAEIESRDEMQATSSTTAPSDTTTAPSSNSMTPPATPEQ